MATQTITLPAFNGVLQSLRQDPRTDPLMLKAGVPNSNKTKRRHTPCIVSDYLGAFLDGPRCTERIRMAKRALQGWLPEFDAIAFRGMSGALIAPPVARGLKKSLIMVRKPSEGCHSLLFVEGDTKAKAYIILDEYTSSGTTQREIRKAVAEFAPQAVCLGLLEVQYIRQESLDQYADGKYRLVYNNPDDPNEYRMKDSE